MSSLPGLHVGLLTGLACAAPVALWLAVPILVTHADAGLHADAAESAVAALWISQALAVAAIVPSDGGAPWRARLQAPLGVLLAPLPLQTALALTPYVDAAELLVGAGLIAIVACARVAVGAALADARWPGPARRPLTRSIEVAMAVTLWLFGSHWHGGPG